MPWVIELRVVSLPATVNVTTNMPNSSSVSWPSASASISVLTMSSPGSLALRCANCMAYQINSPVEPSESYSRELGVVAADHLVGPVEQLLAVLQRDPEKPGDRLQRQLARQPGGRSRRTPAAAASAAMRLRALVELCAQPLDGAGREPAGDDLAQPGCVRGRPS